MSVRDTIPLTYSVKKVSDDSLYILSLLVGIFPRELLSNDISNYVLVLDNIRPISRQR